jgi:hypothetical protein
MVLTSSLMMMMKSYNYSDKKYAKTHVKVLCTPVRNALFFGKMHLNKA